MAEKLRECLPPSMEVCTHGAGHSAGDTCDYLIINKNSISSDRNNKKTNMEVFSKWLLLEAAIARLYIKLVAHLQ